MPPSCHGVCVLLLFCLWMVPELLWYIHRPERIHRLSTVGGNAFARRMSTIWSWGREGVRSVVRESAAVSRVSRRRTPPPRDDDRAMTRARSGPGAARWWRTGARRSRRCSCGPRRKLGLFFTRADDGRCGFTKELAPRAPQRRHPAPRRSHARRHGRAGPSPTAPPPPPQLPRGRLCKPSASARGGSGLWRGERRWPTR
jgi:hypothetical protein